MNGARYFGFEGDYYGLRYVRSDDVRPELHKGNDEIPPEDRDNLFYANKYADRFMQILAMIERGQLTFSSEKESNSEWHAINNARCRYKERAERYEALRTHKQKGKGE